MRTRTLPSRYIGVLDQFRERVQVLESGTKRSAKVAPTTVLVLGLAGTCLVLATLAIDARADRSAASNARAPYAAAPNLAAAAGVAAVPGDFTPDAELRGRPSPAPAPTAEAIPATQEGMTPREELRELEGPASPRPPAPPRPARLAIPTPAPRKPVEIPFEDERPGAVQTVTAAAATPATTLNLGTRLSVRLAGDVVTALNGAPVAATLTTDVVRDGRVILPAGTLLHGDAFATPESDSRAQITWSALVLQGRTIRVTAATLGADEQLGVSGKLVRKGSRTKRGLGSVLGALGRAVSFGAIGGGGIAQRTANEMADRAGTGLDGMGREWAVSDKGIKLVAGTAATLVLRSDVQL